MDYGDIDNPQASEFGEVVGNLGHNAIDIANARSDHISGDFEGFTDSDCFRSLMAGEPFIMSTHGQPVRFAHGWPYKDPDGEGEVANNFPDNGSFLGAFLAEDGKIGADNIEKFSSTGGNAPEKLRSRNAA